MVLRGQYHDAVACGLRRHHDFYLATRYRVVVLTGPHATALWY